MCVENERRRRVSTDFGEKIKLQEKNGAGGKKIVSSNDGMTPWRVQSMGTRETPSAFGVAVCRSPTARSFTHFPQSPVSVSLPCRAQLKDFFCPRCPYLSDVFIFPRGKAQKKD